MTLKKPLPVPLGRPPIDPDVAAQIGASVTRAAAELEAMRVIAILPVFESRFDGKHYTVTVLGQTVTDPILSRAIVMAAKQAGIEIPEQPKLKIPGATP
jgi:hypothetical protein